MFPVCGFLTRPNIVACRGEAPKYWSLLELGIHLGDLFPSYSIGSKKYTGHTYGWEFYRALWDEFDLVQPSSVDRPLDMWGLWLCKWTLLAISMGQRLLLMASGHLSSAWIIMVLDILSTLLITFYATPLWWLPTTSLCLITCPLTCRSLVNSLEVYIPLYVE